MTILYKSTLLDLVQTINDYATGSDDEVVATVTYLVNSGKVLLCGNFAGAKIDLSVPTGVPTGNFGRRCQTMTRHVSRVRPLMRRWPGW